MRYPFQVTLQFQERTKMYLIEMKTSYQLINTIINSQYSKDFYYPTTHARSLASKTYLTSQTLHLFPNAAVDPVALDETQKLVDKYVNKKILMPRNNTYLRFHDGGTGTPNLYLMYLSSKDLWIAKLRRQYEKSVHSKKYIGGHQISKLLIPSTTW